MQRLKSMKELMSEFGDDLQFTLHGYLEVNGKLGVIPPKDLCNLGKETGPGSCFPEWALVHDFRVNTSQFGGGKIYASKTLNDYVAFFIEGRSSTLSLGDVKQFISEINEIIEGIEYENKKHTDSV